MQRIESHLEEIAIDKEINRAICSSDKFFKKRILNITDLKNRIEAISVYKERGSFDEIQKIITRVSKLADSGNLKKDALSNEGYINQELFEKKCESKVFKFIEELEEIFSKDDWNYLKLMNLFEINVNTIEDLFDNEKGVLIMSEDLKIRNNRLNLLSLIRNYSLKIADFTLLNS